MKITIDNQILRNALGKILSVVDKKNSKPILTNCFLQTTNNQLEIIGTDLEVSAKLSVPVDVEEGGKFCVNAKNIFDISKELPNQNVTLSLDQSKNLLHVKCNLIEFSLLITPADEYPVLSFENKENGFEIGAKKLLNLVNKTTHAISTDETRYNLNGIFIQESNSNLRAVATDGHILALIDETDYIGNDNNLENGVIIPKKGVFEIKKLAESNLDCSLKVSVDDSFVYLNSSDNYYLSIRLIAREYPKYQAVIPNKTSFSMRVNKEALATSVKRIRLMANEKSNAIRLSIKNNELLISANHPSLGDAKEKIDIEYSDNDLDIGFNAKYLIDTLSVIEDDEINFEFNNEFSPVIIKADKNPNFVGIVMPLRL
jgi:DNA polymerase-3 subunit beta